MRWMAQKRVMFLCRDGGRKNSGKYQGTCHVCRERDYVEGQPLRRSFWADPYDAQYCDSRPVRIRSFFPGRWRIVMWFWNQKTFKRWHDNVWSGATSFPRAPRSSQVWTGWRGHDAHRFQWKYQTVHKMVPEYADQRVKYKLERNPWLRGVFLHLWEPKPGESRRSYHVSWYAPSRLLTQLPYCHSCEGDYSESSQAAGRDR